MEIEGIAPDGRVAAQELEWQARRRARGWVVLSTLLFWLTSRARGQSLLEYTILFLLMVLAIVGSLIIFGPQLASIYKDIENNI